MKQAFALLTLAFVLAASAFAGTQPVTTGRTLKAQTTTAKPATKVTAKKKHKKHHKASSKKK